MISVFVLIGESALSRNSTPGATHGPKYVVQWLCNRTPSAVDTIGVCPGGNSLPARRCEEVSKCEGQSASDWR